MASIKNVLFIRKSSQAVDRWTFAALVAQLCVDKSHWGYWSCTRSKPVRASQSVTVHSKRVVKGSHWCSVRSNVTYHP